MMGCPRCHVFIGNPCVVCRTGDRVIGLLPKLGVFQETRAVAALRECAGSLADLVEEAEAVRVSVTGTGSVVASASGGPLPEAHPGNNPEKEKEAEEREEPPRTEKEKPSTKEKKRKLKGKDKEGKRSKEKKRKTSDTEETPAPSSGSRVPARDFPLTAAENDKEDREREAEEDRQRAIDKRVSEHPEEHGLARISVRGSAGKHFEEDLPVFAPPHSGKPPEPKEPPRRREASSHDGRGGRRDRPRSPEKRWKGYRHYLRGREHWKQFKKDRRK